jgi:hypothetical protein
MRKKRVLLLLAILLIVCGLSAIFIGTFAYQIGLDNNPVMGEKRKFLVALGCFLLFLQPLGRACEWVSQQLSLPRKGSSFANWCRQTRFSRWLNSRQKGPLGRFLDAHSWIWVLTGGLLVFLTALWYLTAGTFTHWTPYFSYYDREADAFLAGQVSLLEQPAAALAQLPDVYSFTARQGIGYLWDVSYYNGKYYLYWGPVPALVAAAIKLIHPGVVEDQVLILIFISGIAVILGALFHWLRKTYFPSAPGWTVLLFTLTGCLSLPLFWLVNRPAVYEAAIASAQFFLLLGIYAALRGIAAKGKKNGWLLLAGFSLGAAVCSRFTYVFSVLAVCLVVGVMLIKNSREQGFKLAPWLCFGLPLAGMAVGLMEFNYVRFGNILESGLRYQLTGEILPSGLKGLFSWHYTLANFYSSVLRPLGTTPGQFPFFSTPFVLDNMWPNFVHRAKTYSSGEPVVGVLAAVPFLWLLVILLVFAVKHLLDWIDEKPRPEKPVQDPGFPVWALLLIVAPALIQFTIAMTYIMSTMRFLADFSLLLILCTALMVWTAFSRLKDHTVWRRLLLTLTTLLCVASIGIGLLTNMQGADYRFENNNPDLYAKIACFFE